ncbi:bile acid:sodium symporter family protein ['Paenibacillus yunnanensis' Narsing Rao et al. 2020]|uniref:bile acid:sodium symporter family protein n=1 Tax=Paenibacillus tengchongensis TaxID=2608684 RepID=UPI00124EFBD0|nr:bile acid:sodium symporter family protein [Paenibacillus tengchongensis]
MRQQWLQFNHFLERLVPVTAPASLILGIVFSVWLKPFTGVVPWVFAFMTFAGSLSSNFNDLKWVLRRPYPLVASLIILHMLMPLLGFVTGNLVFQGDPLVITGILLAFAIPTGIVSFMWVSIYKGNIALTLSLILIDTLLAPFVVPLTLKVLVGAEIRLDIWGMMQSLVLMVALPSIAGLLLNHRTKGKVKLTLSPILAPFSKLGLILVISINSSVIAPYLIDFSVKLAVILLTMLLLAACGYFIGWQCARLFKWDHSIATALTFNCGMRNINAGTVLAITYFPAAVAVPVIMCSLFQQILASIYAQLLSRFGPKPQQEEQPTLTHAV